MAGREHLLAPGPRQVEQDPAGDDGTEVMDPEPSRAELVDLVGRIAVVEVAVDADVRQAVDVRGGLLGEGDEILVEARAVRGHVLGDVDPCHGHARVGAALDEAQLNTLGRRERKAQRQGLAGHH